MIVIYTWLGLVGALIILYTVVKFCGFWIWLLHITYIDRLQWNDTPDAQTYGKKAEEGYKYDFIIFLLIFGVILVSIVALLN
jgi:hypothetical protein